MSTDVRFLTFREILHFPKSSENFITFSLLTRRIPAEMKSSVYCASLAGLIGAAQIEEPETAKKLFDSFPNYARSEIEESQDLIRKAVTKVDFSGIPPLLSEDILLTQLHTRNLQLGCEHITYDQEVSFHALSLSLQIGALAMVSDSSVETLIQQAHNHLETEIAAMVQAYHEHKSKLGL